MLRSITAFVCVLGASLWVSAAHAQDPTLLVLDPIGTGDPAVVGDVIAVAEARGYRVLRPGAGSVVGALDPASGADLVSVVQRTGVHRAVAVWVRPSGVGFEVRVGVATHDGSATSVLRTAPLDGVHALAGSLLAELLPGPFAVTSHSWAPVITEVAAEAVEPIAPAIDRHRSRNIGLMVAGYVAFGVGWVADLVIGPFGGYQDRTCIDLGSWGGCDGPLPPGTSFQPAWDDFRALSLVPIAGPWMQLAAKPPSGDDLWPAFLVIDGIVQGAGAILMIVGTALFVADEDREAEPSAPSVMVLPTFGPDGSGLSVAGRF